MRDDGDFSGGGGGGGESLEGRMLIAMPSMSDPRFARTLNYICAHSEEGAMGLVVNKRADNLSFPELLEQLNIPTGPEAEQIHVHYGGPVEMGRGFVLHSADFHVAESTLKVDDQISLTATLEILKALVDGDGPERALLALGYAGWGPGQLEGELQHNGWLHCEADNRLVFGAEDSEKWTAALTKIGVDPSLLSGEGGRA